MSVWGIGAYYKGSSPKDKTEEFIKKEAAFIGWSETDASALYRMFDSIKVGDIIYIKSFVPKHKQLRIKSIGIVTKTEKIKDASLGAGISVKWIKKFSPIIIDITPEIFRNNVFNNTIYEEYNEEIILRIVDCIIS